MIKDKVLIADDEEGVRDLCSVIAEEEGYEVVTASDGLEALQKSKEHLPDVILLDVRMPEMDGMEVFQKLKEDLIDAPVIFVTAFGSSDLAIEAMKQGAYDYITKPFDIDEIRIVLKKALHLKKLTSEISSLKSKKRPVSSTELIGSSHIMQDVFKNIGMVSKNTASVLLQGDPGTECKEVARTIHQKAFPTNGQFIEVSCFENEESFREEIKKIKAASDTTIYIKDIHLLSTDCQEALLQKIMQEKNARYISSTTNEITQRVKGGQYNEQLYFTLSAIRLSIPSLKDRVDDIEELGLFMIDRLNEEYSKNIKGFTSESLQVLKQYDWPGNVGELKNVLTHCVIAAKSNFITKENLPTFLLNNPTIQKVDPNETYTELTLTEAVQQFEKDYIRKVLKMQKGNKTKTATSLGISRRSLFNKMRAYHLLDESI